MKKYKQIAIYILFIGIIGVLFGTTYAFFNYTRTGATNTLIVGNIYMNHTQGTEITLTDEFPQKKEVARERSDNVITITVTGYNESEKDIYYKLMLNLGDEITGRNRIDDKFLRFDLIEELPNNEERFVVFNESFDTINNTILVKDRIDAGTSPSNSVSKTYKLRMWIGDDILISDTDEEADYSTSEFMNLFGSVKITAKGDTENVYYYDTFENALAAVNSGTYESNTTRSLTKAGVYIDSDDNTTNLVLYDDDLIVGNKTITNPVDINLYGYTLTEKRGQYNASSLILRGDSSLINGSITAMNTEQSDYYFGLDPRANLKLNNLFISELTSDYKCLFYAKDGAVSISNSHIENCKFQQYSTNVDSSVHLNNVEYYSEFNIFPDTVAVIDDSIIFADSPGCYINPSTDRYYNCKVGIYNGGTLIFNSGYVFGTHSGVQTSDDSKTYVYGGTFESTDHGGFYFAQGPSGVAYIENANIGGIDYPANGKYRPNGKVNSIEYNGATYNLEEGRVAFYSGGNTSQNGESVYLVNCNIYAKGGEFIVVRSSTPQQNVYFSGTKFLNTRTDQYIRLQNFNTMRLYLGSGNDFGLVNQVYNSGTRMPFDTAREAGAIIDTNVSYKDIVRPE